MQITPQKQKALATFGLLFGATAWGIVWYPFRLLEQAGISGLASCLYTFAVALVVGLVSFSALRRRICRVPAKTVWLVLAAGWTNLAYVLAVIDGEVMRIMLLFYLSPLWTLMLARLMLDERPGRGGGAIVTLSLGGALLMLWQPDAGMPLPQNRSEWLALSAGICFALTNVLTRQSEHLSLESKSLAIWVGVVVVGLLVLPFQSASVPLPHEIGLHGLLLMAGIGVLMMLTTMLVQFGITHTLVTRASVIFLFELVVAALSSWWLAGEVMSLREWAGGAMIVTAALFATRD